MKNPNTKGKMRVQSFPKKVNFKVDGKLVTLDFAEDLGIFDLNKEQKEIAGKMAYWGAVWGSAEGEKIKTEAQYRRWRAELTTRILEKDPKLAEWKVRSLIESDDKFLMYKEAISRAEEQVITCRSLFDSYKKKANQLQSQGAFERASFNATKIRTKK